MEAISGMAGRGLALLVSAGGDGKTQGRRNRFRNRSLPRTAAHIHSYRSGQLQSDIHESYEAITEEVEAGKLPARDPAVLTINAHVRTASMMAQMARRSEWLTWTLIGLTVVLILLTGVLAWLTWLLAFKGG